MTKLETSQNKIIYSQTLVKRQTSTLLARDMGMEDMGMEDMNSKTLVIGMNRPAPNACLYPNAAMFMMGAGNMNILMNMNTTAANMNMANMSNMGMFNAPMPFL